jgi:hypothetical protein
VVSLLTAFQAFRGCEACPRWETDSSQCLNVIPNKLNGHQAKALDASEAREAVYIFIILFILDEVHALDWHR